jgi:hypothetical protein
LYPKKFNDFEVLLNYDQVDKLIGQKNWSRNNKGDFNIIRYKNK